MNVRRERRASEERVVDREEEAREGAQEAEREVRIREPTLSGSLVVKS